MSCFATHTAALSFTEAEKKTSETALEAHHTLDKHLKKTMMDYTVEQVDETKIIEVIK